MSKLSTNCAVVAVALVVCGCGAAGGNCEPSRRESESCCPSLGIDACGAGLTCAALDGRTVATCYFEHSRSGLQECTDAVQCVSGECGSTHKCRSVIGEHCESLTGCADGSICHAGTCAARGNGDCGAPCNGANDCRSGLLCGTSSGTCGLGTGASTSDDSCCINGSGAGVCDSYSCTWTCN